LWGTSFSSEVFLNEPLCVLRGASFFIGDLFEQANDRGV
jgi:hypothetical protein